MKCCKWFLNILSVTAFTLNLFSCGEGSVEIGRNTYEPKIVIEGYLYPGQRIEKIKITRNIPVNTKVDPSQLILYDSDVRLIDIQSNKEFKLTFNQKKLYFEYSGNDISIGFDRSYKLVVSAAIDGKALTANSITHTPKSGFRINDELTADQAITYRETDSKGDVKKINLTFSPSVGTSFYFISTVSLNASDSSFVYNNPYAEIKSADVRKDLDRYKYQLRWLQNINSSAGLIRYDLDWMNIWFYGDYRIVIYACDENFRLYLLTYKNVQEFDGNFHEPRVNIQGDGIGIFGSAIADTVYLKVKK